MEIANDIREAIARGEYQVGDRLPGENVLMQRYGVARATARDALAVLRHEGLAIARPGAGVYVTSRKRLIRDSTDRYSRRQASPPPFMTDAANSNHEAGWEHVSERKSATTRVAELLGIAVGEPVMETAYRFFADGSPVQLSWSWEPLSLTGGTPVEQPEEGSVTGVIARMDAIGQRVDRVVEKVTARAATTSEAERLQLPQRGSYVLVIERRHYAGDLAVEACDIVFPGDRYELTYAIPVPD
ncbi:GntR family transcriptional regulator [Catellatospora sp. NEAU-YM18]|nr:GntR family transcriptional regulator [Catellatospora tritici]